MLIEEEHNETSYEATIHDCNKVINSQKVLLRAVGRPHCHVISSSRHRPVTYGILCCRGICLCTFLLRSSSTPWSYLTLNLPSWKAVGLRTGDVSELGLRSLNISVACQFCALLSHVLTAYYLVTVVDSCSITRFIVFFLYFRDHY